MARIHNFSAGPAVLPVSVVEELRANLLDLNGSGIGLMEISHRSKTFQAVVDGAEARVKRVLGVPADYTVLFLQGGASLQFYMTALNLLRPGDQADYLVTGTWAQKAIKEAKRIGDAKAIWDDAPNNFKRVPQNGEYTVREGAVYLHYTSNNTIYGTEWERLPQLEADVPLVVDLSSNIGSREMGLENVALGYAGAQKNLGPSGVTIVFVREDLLGRSAPGPVPTMMRYATHAAEDSLYNTPNTFGILVLRNVLEWMRDHDGVAGIGAANERKANALYETLDGSTLYRAHAKPGSRSRMNVTWTLVGKDEAEGEALTKRFLAAAQSAGFCGLKGHRLVGGCRASIYNAFPEHGVQALVAFMREFERTA